MPYTVNVKWLKSDMFPPTDEDIYIMVDHPCVEPVTGAVMIGVQIEPRVILPHIYQLFIDNHTRFDTILTYDDEVIRKCPNARYCILTCSWIAPSTYNNLDVSRKQRKISCLTGQKRMTLGHEFRLRLYMNQHTSFLPITWFRSSKDVHLLPRLGNNPVIGESKDPLFLDYQFSIIIENCQQTNYFTEKLLDCLITKTVPIYWGCPNISNWFDTRGWIILETDTVAEVGARCSHLPVYSRFINVINENYERAKYYASIETNIQRVMNFGV